MTVQTSRSPAAIRAAATAHPAATPRQAWLIIALLFLFMVINFADKAVIGIAAVPIMDELLLSPREFGLLARAFFCCLRSRRSSPALSSTGSRRAGRCWAWG
jgi:MFS transporter, ACS family, D-galactonate transporter